MGRSDKVGHRAHSRWWHEVPTSEARQVMSPLIAGPWFFSTGALPPSLQWCLVVSSSPSVTSSHHTGVVSQALLYGARRLLWALHGKNSAFISPLMLQSTEHIIYLIVTIKTLFKAILVNGLATLVRLNFLRNMYLRFFFNIARVEPSKSLTGLTAL